MIIKIVIGQDKKKRIFGKATQFFSNNKPNIYSCLFSRSSSLSSSTPSAAADVPPPTTWPASCTATTFRWTCTATLQPVLWPTPLNRKAYQIKTVHDCCTTVLRGMCEWMCVLDSVYTAETTLWDVKLNTSGDI